MATDKPRFSITLDYDTMDSVMKYKDEKKLSTQSKAIQRLIEIGLESIVSELGISPVPSVSLSQNELQVIADFKDASDEIREEAAAMLHRSAERNRQERAKSSSSAG